MKNLLSLTALVVSLFALVNTGIFTDAGTISRPAKTFGGTSFVNNVVPDASDFNGDVDTLYSEVNGLLDSANIEDDTVEGIDIKDGTLADVDIDSVGITSRSKLPTPLAYKDEAGVFSVSQKLSGSSLGWEFEDPGGFDFLAFNNAGTWHISSDDPGPGFASILQLGSSGNLTLTGDIKTSQSCIAGLSRVGSLCIDTDGQLAELVNDSTNGNVNDTTVAIAAGADMAILKVECSVSQDGTPDSSQTSLYIRPATPGDDTADATELACGAGADLANERSLDTGLVFVYLDSSGDFEWETNMSGAVAARNIVIRRVGYLDNE